MCGHRPRDSQIKSRLESSVRCPRHSLVSLDCLIWLAAQLPRTEQNKNPPMVYNRRELSAKTANVSARRAVGSALIGIRPHHGGNDQCCQVGDADCVQ